MGGDNAPDAILAGSLGAIDLLGRNDCLVLVGDEDLIRQHIHQQGLDLHPKLEIEPTTQVIGMAESPVNAIRNKPDSSIVRMGQLGGRKAGQKRCEVIISAGNTGACVAAAQMHMRRLPGVHRPGIAVTIPSFFGPIVLCDVGANPEPKSFHLHQYGHMACIFANRIIGIDNPRVALLSIGGEEGKGNQLTRETHKLLKSDNNLNYVGYIEGRGMFDGKAEVIITEGFTGNVVLKLCEGLSMGLFKTITHEILEYEPQLAGKFEPIIKNIYRKHDYHEYGGAPLLGANGICLILHGSSEARTIRAAVRSALKYTKLHVNDGIVEVLAKTELAPEEVV